MPNTNIPSEQYPFATQDGKAIPLDILKPLGLLILPFTTDAVASISLPESSAVAMMIASEACLISFDHSLVTVPTNEFLSKVLLVPYNNVVSCSIPSLDIKVRGVDANGTLYVQLIEKWAGLALARQYQRK